MTRLRPTRVAPWVRGRRRVGGLLVISAAAISTVILTGAFTGVFTGASPPALTRQQAAQRILRTEVGRLLTAPAQSALHMLASGGRQLTGGLGLPPPARGGLFDQDQAGPVGGTVPLPKPAFRNVRVNDPSLDTHQPDQTTQSETAIAIAGSHVAVGYNDSQATGLIATAGSSLTGYSYSTDGGATFTDGGALPNTPEFINAGDPWLTSDHTGTMYFSNLAFDFFNQNFDVTVAKSTNGGRTWRTPVPVFRPPFNILYIADKDAVTAGRDPLVSSRDDIYIAWDDFSVNLNTGSAFVGLPVARSSDGGATWHVTYAKKFRPGKGCSIQQFTGATPIVSKTNGVLYVVAEKLAVNDPNCTGTAPLQRSEWIFRSTDGGRTFGAGVKIAGVSEAVPNGALFLGPGRYMRDLEFPTIALRGKAIYVAWNDGALGESHIKLATSTDAGQTWSSSFITRGSGDEVQPALSADSSGIHMLYYHRNPNNTLDVYASTSANGRVFSTERVTTQSFPGTLTVPQFDPILAPAYMGDYIANVSAGNHQYYAWGDNRDRVTNFLYPHGRNDPDVFFARN